MRCWPRHQRFPANWDSMEIRQWVMDCASRAWIPQNGQNADASLSDGETGLWPLVASGSRSLMVAFADAPDGRTRHAAFHKQRIIRATPRT